MLIHVAQNGRMYELDCQGSTLVEVIHNTLAALTGIAASDQMLICGDTRLEATRSLSYYRLPTEDRRVFLFNRAALLPDSPSPGLEEIEIVELNIPQAPSLLDAGHPLDESPNPLLRALPSYERQFKYHLQKGQGIFRASQARYDICRRLVQEQQVQELALETACGNMGLYYNHICGAHKEFMEQFNRQHGQHSELLACFERDMERLRQCELHPALRSQSPLRRTLLDCVKEPALRKWAHDCTISHALFASKVGELQSLFAELQRNVDDLLQRTPDVDVAQLEVRLEESHKYIEEQTSILQSLSKDLSTVKKLVEDCVGGRLTSSLRPLDACAALDPMNDVHLNSHLPRVETCDRKLTALLQFTYECKTKMSRCVHEQLQTVAALQSRIRDLRNQLAAFREAMARQDEIFAELSLVRRVASSYQACLAEVVRRKAFATLYMGQAGHLAEKMARIRGAELARRDEFVHLHSPRYLPRDVLEGMGLLGAPSVCEVSVPEFDLSLLDVTVHDLQLRSAGGRGGVLSNRFATSGKQEGGLEPAETGRMDGALGEGGGEEEGEAGTEGSGGFGKLEMENAWLRSELAAAMAGVYVMQAESSGRQGSEAAEAQEKSYQELTARTAEALKLKDAHTAQLQQALKAQESKTHAYEQRIRDLEAHLQELQQQASRQTRGGASEATLQTQGSPTSSAHADAATDVSGVTGEGHLQPIMWQEGMQMHVSPDLEAMDETGEEAEVAESSMGIAGTGTQVLSASQGPRAAPLLQSPAQDGGSPLGQAHASAQDHAGAEIDGQDHRMHGPADLAGEHGASEADVQGVRVQAAEAREGETGPREEVGLEAGNQEEARMEARMEVRMEARQTQTEQEVAMVASQVEELQRLLTERSSACSQAQSEAAEIRSQLKHNLNLLSECQVNCAHLENQLHKAREEARTQRAAAERRGAEYSSVRSESVRLRGYLERLSRCLAPTGNGGPSAEALRVLASSLASRSEGEGDVPSGEWVRAAVRVLADRVAVLASERATLLEKSAAADAKIERLGKQLESAANVLQILAAKHERAEHFAQLGRQKICYMRFQVHELAAFLPDKVGRYVAINGNCPNHFLADESVALFRQHAKAQGQSELPACIVGQIVHIERSVARASSGSDEASPTTGKSRYGGNPYSLPVGASFAVVTVAMVPDVASMPSGAPMAPPAPPAQTQSDATAVPPPQPHPPPPPSESS